MNQSVADKHADANTAKMQETNANTLADTQRSKTFKIGIFSGKGGVGKTTICASLAILLKEQGISVLLADTDVDAPNLALLFKRRSLVEKYTFKTTEKASHIIEKCRYCKLCIYQAFCPYDAISWDADNGIPVIDQIKCEGCRACALLCPFGAFKISGIDSGIVQYFEAEPNLPLIAGETILGAQSSGKLVTELKKVAEKVAQQRKISLLLQDGPPGIGCPVIAATGGLDLVIVIMEPTKPSLHDADRYFQIPKRFGIPMTAIINKADINPEGTEKIKEYLRKNSIELLGEIPLDEMWPLSVASAQPMIRFDSAAPASRELKKIAGILKEKLKY